MAGSAVGGAMRRGLAAVKRASKQWLKQGLSKAMRGRAGAAPAIPPAHWGLAPDASGTLTLAGVSLTRLVAEHGSPLHVVDASRLRDNARAFLAVPEGRANGGEVFYSYKTNPVPGVLRELHALGVGAEVISHYELWLARELGVPPEKIIYNGPGKSEASIRLAIELGIELLNVNHAEELAVVSRIAAEHGRRPRVGLRVTFGGWAGQFGIGAAGGQALRAFERALSDDALHVVGLHVHRGGMIHTQSELSQFMDDVLGFADELRARLGLGLEVLDVGGSLGSRSVRGLGSREQRLNRTFSRPLEAPRPDEQLSISAYVAHVLERVDAHYGARSEPAPRVFFEPGRALTSDTQLLITRVLSLKDGAERKHAILDAGINLAESCRAEYHQILPVETNASGREGVYTLVGPICSPADTLRWAERLPELAPGDALAIMDSGAYFVPFATSFSFPQPAIVLLDEGRSRPIRRAETFDDLVSHDHFSRAAGPTVGSAS